MSFAITRSIFDWRSLKTRLTLITLAIFVFSIWSLAFYTSLVLQEDLRALLGEKQLSTVSFVAAEVNAEIEDRLQALNRTSAQLTPALMSDPQALHHFLKERPILQQMFNGGTFLANPAGNVVAAFPDKSQPESTQYSKADFMVAALTEGRTAIGEPAPAAGARSPQFVMAAPVRDAGGQVIGALAGVTNLDMPGFLDKVTHNSYGKTGRYVLVAPQQRLLVISTDRRRVMEKLPEPGVNPLVDRFLGGYRGTATGANALGENVIASTQTVAAAGWYVGATLPTEDAYAPIRATQRRMLLAAFVLTVLAGTLTWWVLGRQLAPTVTAARQLASLADSDQAPPPLPVTTHDEVGQLISGFNHLLETLGRREQALQKSLEERRRAEAQLERHQELLEDKVEERTAQLRALTSQLAMSEERERQAIAQDLHDNLGQSLAVIRLRLKALASSGGRDGDTSFTDQVREVDSMVEQANRAIRSLSIQLRPPVLSRYGLVAALESLCEELHHSYQLRVHLRDEAAHTCLDEAVSSSLYRIVRELLINVAKHAGVGEAEVAICAVDGKLVITVSDAGAGFDPDHRAPASADGGFGLYSVRDRLLYMGGDLQVDSRPGEGTLVVVSVPLDIARA